MFQFYHRICVSGKKSPRRGTVKSLSGVSSSLAEVAEGPNPRGARGAATPRTSALHARLRPPAPACSACLAAVTAPGPPKRACHSAVHGTVAHGVPKKSRHEREKQTRKTPCTPWPTAETPGRTSGKTSGQQAHGKMASVAGMEDTHTTRRAHARQVNAAPGSSPRRRQGGPAVS